MKLAGAETSSISYGRVVAAATGHGFNSHQPDSFRLAVVCAVLSALDSVRPPSWSAGDTGRYNTRPQI